MTTIRSMLRQLGKLRALRQGVPEMIDRTVSYISLMSIRSELPIDVMIPAADKDADILPYALDGIRANVRHPISQVFIVAPESDRIRRLCQKKRCEFIPERELLGFGPESIGLEVQGADRSKWIYQQFLKWSSDAIVRSSHFLAVDADTVLVRPQVFERDGRSILNYSDEYYQPYFEMYARLLREPALSPVSFISHHMLFEVAILRELKNRIEVLHECNWQEAILRNLDRQEMSGCSEYENYGQYAFAHHPKEVAIEYWFNLNLSRRKLGNVKLLRLKYGGKYKSLSFHSYRE